MQTFSLRRKDIDNLHESFHEYLFEVGHTNYKYNQYDISLFLKSLSEVRYDQYNVVDNNYDEIDFNTYKEHLAGFVKQFVRHGKVLEKIVFRSFLEFRKFIELQSPLIKTEPYILTALTFPRVFLKLQNVKRKRFANLSPILISEIKKQIIEGRKYIFEQAQKLPIYTFAKQLGAEFNNICFNFEESGTYKAIKQLYISAATNRLNIKLTWPKIERVKKNKGLFLQAIEDDKLALRRLRIYQNVVLKGKIKSKYIKPSVVKAVKNRRIFRKRIRQIQKTKQNQMKKDMFDTAHFVYFNKQDNALL